MAWLLFDRLINYSNNINDLRAIQRFASITSGFRVGTFGYFAQGQLLIAAQQYISEVSAIDNRPFKFGIGHKDSHQNGVGEVSLCQPSGIQSATSQINVGHIGAGKISTKKPRATQVGVAEIAVAHIALAKVGVAEILVRKVGFNEGLFIVS
jgi:hypothetical protein